MELGVNHFGSYGSFVSGGGLKGESTASKGSVNLARHPIWSSDGEGQQRREDYAEAEASSGPAARFRRGDKTGWIRPMV